MSTTLEARADLDHPRATGRRLGIVFLLVAALVVGLATGLLVSATLDDGSAPEYVTPGGGQLTDRQALMLDVVEQYADAWHSTDGDGVASFMTQDAYVEYPEQGMRFEVADGSLQARVTNGPYASMVEYEPLMVFDDRVVLTGQVGPSIRWLSILRFTTTGDVKIVSERIYL
jgi:hypothetical protein